MNLAGNCKTSNYYPQLIKNSCCIIVIISMSRLIAVIGSYFDHI